MNRVRISKPTRGRRSPLLLWSQRTFLCIGLLLVGYYAYAQGEMVLFQSYENWRLDQIQQGKPDSVARYVEHWFPWWEDEGPDQSKTGEVEARNRRASRAGAPKGSLGTSGRTSSGSAGVSPAGSLIGRIQIPRLALSAIVLEGVGSDTLRLAVGHLPGTPLPGDPGNVDLAAHRDTFFHGLQRVREGDLVSLSTTSGRLYRYRVHGVVITDPSNTQVLNIPRGPGLNLITCYPFNYVGPAPRRYVVHADEISESAGLPVSLTSSPRHIRNPRHRSSRAGRLAAAREIKTSPSLDSRGTAGSPSVSEETIAPDETDPPAAATTSGSRFSGIRKFFRKVFKSKRSG